MMPVVYIVTKGADGLEVPIPPEGLDLSVGSGRLRTDAEGRALELPTGLRDHARKEQKRMRRAGARNIRTTVVLRNVA